MLCIDFRYSNSQEISVRLDFIVEIELFEKHYRYKADKMPFLCGYFRSYVLLNN